MFAQTIALKTSAVPAKELPGTMLGRCEKLAALISNAKGTSYDSGGGSTGSNGGLIGDVEL